MLVDIRGQQIGQLQITRQLGEGGMGSVYLAEHSVIGVKRAIKVLHPQFSQNAFVVQRFFNEALASARLAHRNIVGVHDLGQLQDGTHYIIFDFVPGRTLASLIDSHGPIPPREIARVVGQTANALRVAHFHGIVHRDLKPENIQLTTREEDDGHVVVLDWGIAHLSDNPQGGPRTQTGMLLGTPVYMSPEQLRGQPVDESTDMFALGIIVYRMATGGWFPYQRDHEDYYSLTPAELALRQRDNAIEDPRKRNPHLSEEFARVLLTALATDPARRPKPKEYALEIAKAAPPDGCAMLLRYARELLDAESEARIAAASMGSGHAGTPAASVQRYRLVKQIGAGGMAEVFLASKTSAAGIERTVAVKRVLPQHAKDEPFVKMFIAEAQIAMQLQHPNIVTVEECEHDADRQLFIAMEYVDGRDLQALVKTIAERGPLPMGVVIFVVVEVLYALRYAHNLPQGKTMRGVVHRDISPSNILLSWDGAVKLSDFGLAKARHEAVVEASVFLKGKPRYMSPEQTNNLGLDGRSDLFAVGVVLWELLTGQQLFDAQHHEGVIQQVRGPHEIVPPSRRNPNVPRDLDRVTMKLLERDVGRRYANANDAIAELLACRDVDPGGRNELMQVLARRFPAEAQARLSRSLQGSNLGPTAPALPSAAPRLIASSPTTHGTATGQAVRGGSRTRRHWVAALAVVLVVAAIAMIATQTGGSDPTLAVASPASGPALDGGSPDARDSSAVPPAPGSASPVATPSDGSTRAVVEPPSAAPKITIVTEPPGALVLIDGVVHGRAPVTVPAVVGARLSVEAVQDGFVASKESVIVDRGDQMVTLRLRSLTAAKVRTTAPRSDTKSRKQPTTPTRPGPREMQQPGRGSGSSFDDKGLITDPNL